MKNLVFLWVTFLVIFTVYLFTFSVFTYSVCSAQTTIPVRYDASGSFNERGYYKTNSGSYDENEIISNYNGNLNYTIPIHRVKGPGDMYVDLSLNYNGAINYQVVAATSNTASLNRLPRYNISAPGWVLSLNGMAVQMFNFETNFFTIPGTDKKANNEKVRLLAQGYHITDNLKLSSPTDQDVICLMQGDGSVIYLERMSTGCGGNNNEECYIGEYYTNGVGEYARAKVEYIEYNTTPAYRNRRVSLTKGDGLTYIYEEYKNEYADFGINSPSSVQFKPQVFLLKAIKDRFGHTLELIYDYTYRGTWGDNKKVYGRPLLTSISVTWQNLSVNFSYNLQPALSVLVSSYNGNFKIKCPNQAGNLDSTGNHRFYPSEIENQAGSKMNLTYEYYKRKAIELFNPLTGYEDMELLLNQANSTNSYGLMRLKTVTNYFGAKREYGYLNSPDSELTIDMSPPEFNKISSDIVNTNYYGQGRDLFYTNMLSLKTVKNSDNQTISEETYSYNYQVYSSQGYKIDPVNDADNYTTTVSVINPAGLEIYETPYKKKNIYHYKNYKIQLENTYVPNPEWQETPDWQGHTKLIKTEEFINDSSTPYKTNDYYFLANDSAGFVARNSFLDTAIATTIYNVLTKKRFKYEYQTSPFISADEKYKNPLSSVIETDIYGQSVLTLFLNLYETGVNYKYAKYYANEPPEDQQYDTTQVYFIHLPLSKRIYNSQNELKYRDSIYYLTQNDTNYGYIGQSLFKRIYNTSETDYKQTTYHYFTNDRIGINLYPIANTKPSNEGNLKCIRDNNGDSIKYYYHPVNAPSQQTDDIIRPRLEYLVHKVDGTVQEVSSIWEDIRFPVITEFYPHGSNDTIRTYSLYNNAGDVTKTINSNGFLSNYSYQDPLQRISMITLPGDFGEQDTTFSIDTVYESVEATIKADLISAVDLLSPKTEFFTKYNNLCAVTKYYSNISNFFMSIIDSGGPPSLSSTAVLLKIPLIRIRDTSIFKDIYEINSANFKFFPILFQRYTGSNSDTSIEKVKLELTLLKSMYETQDSILYQETSLSNKYSIYAPMENNYGNCNIFYENNLDITNLLNTHLFINNDSIIAFKLYAKAVYSTPDPPRQEYFMPLYNCPNFLSWCSNYSPVLQIYGKRRIINIDTILTYRTFTTKFEYQDNQNNSGDRYVKTGFKQNETTVGTKETLFDELYRVKENRLYLSSDFNNYVKSTIKYNYLGLKLETKDGRENITKYSYNEFLNPSKTENPDASYTLQSETYYNGYPYTFGLIPGMVVKKVFTDETGNRFDKYYDAVGNLRREVKYIEGIPSDNPPPEELIPQNTDYKYDDLYRVIEVKTPNDKHIYYSYDEFGRQSSRTTPDAGLVKYKYDKNDNLRFSQDANQLNRSTETPPAKYITFRGYDGMNRMLYIGETQTENYIPAWDNLNPQPGQNYGFENYSLSPGNFLTVNVYDTLANYPANANIFTSQLPQDYYGEENNTKGNLTATAYRTKGEENWSYKYYRYDSRGRVKKMWNYISGLGMKVTYYYYNSQNQLIMLKYQNTNDNDYRAYYYNYDYAGRLQSVSTDQSGPPPDYIVPFAEYSYNENSQISQTKYNNNSYNITNTYNSRNWLTQSTSSNGMFEFTLGYLSNGNVNTQYLTGSYRANFPDIKEIKSLYSYDKSNRLKKTEKYSSKYYDLAGEYSFDPDGNFLTHTRSFNGDNFNYDYYPYTNKLRKVTGTENQFTYDYNGNMTNDYLNENINISYDHRNLITEINRTNPLEDPPTEIKIRYRYDESGNRTRKTIYQSTIENPPPIPGEGDLPPGWIITSDEYYIRDAQGKEIAIYQGYNLDFWNVWGMGNEGRIKSTGTNYFYLKDHLGSIRAVLNQNNELVGAIDLDAWGYLARSWDTTSTRYKFTGKERDNESGYDYFGARYFNSRTAVWQSTDPLFEKHIQFTPYNYVLGNPMILIDPDGRQIYFSNNEKLRNMQVNDLKSFLQPEYSDFISSVIDEDGHYVLDVSLLETAIDCLNTNYISAEYSELRFLANNSLATMIMYYYENGIIQANITGESGVAYANLNSKLIGLTILTDKTDNPVSTPSNYSISGNNEVYILSDQSAVERTKTLAHELRLHVFRYLNKIRWSHKPEDVSFEEERKEIEKQAEINFQLNKEIKK